MSALERDPVLARLSVWDLALVGSPQSVALCLLALAFPLACRVAPNLGMKSFPVRFPVLAAYLRSAFRMNPAGPLLFVCQDRSSQQLHKTEQNRRQGILPASFSAFSVWLRQSVTKDRQRIQT